MNCRYMVIYRVNSIKESVGGDIFEIRTVEAYPTDYNAVVDKLKRSED